MEDHLIVLATVIKLKSDDGLIEMWGDRLGKVYKVETNSRRMSTCYNLDKHITHEKEMIATVPFEGWLPTELLELGGVP